MIKMLGITGSMGCGKTYTCEQLALIAKEKGINVNYISVDQIRRDILGTNELYQKQRNEIIKLCGREIIDSDGVINRVELGKIIFSNPEKMRVFREIINPIIKRIIEEMVFYLEGLVLVEWALLVEDNLLDIVSHNVLVVTCSREKQIERFKDSDLPTGQVIKRINYGLTNDEKIKKIKNNKGNLFVFDTTNDPSIDEYRELFNEIAAIF